MRLHPKDGEGLILQQLILRAAELDQTNPLVQRALTLLAQRIAEVITVHSVATELLKNQPWDFGAVYYECSDQVGHAFVPYHPPRLPEIAGADFEVFQHVISGVYRFHDLMLQRLLQLAGPETYVMIIYDGFESGERRPDGIQKIAKNMVLTLLRKKRKTLAAHQNKHFHRRI
ncbi:MAG: alkaline phosphatase family protein [Verrucomicrobiota bacterium]|nr:alkaline phosphatase family protein [Verrucomicrobiota bacterium]